MLLDGGLVESNQRSSCGFHSCAYFAPLALAPLIEAQLVEPEFAYHEGARESLCNQCHHDHDECADEHPIASREGATVRDSPRNAQCRSETDHATHPAERDDER